MFSKSLNLFCLAFCFLATDGMAKELTLDEVLASPSNPLHLESVLQSNSSSALITKNSGGQISLTGLDGTFYTLTFPAGSVQLDIQITMTETKDLKLNNVAFGSFGVQIYPDGLELIQPAMLEIKTNRPLNPKTFSIITSKNDGTLGHIPALFNFKSQSVQLQLFHFSNYAATDEEKIQEIIDLGMADIEQIRITNWMNRLLLTQKLTNAEIEGIIFKSLQEVAVKVVAPKLASVSTCTGGSEALDSFNSLSRQASLFGIDMDKVLKEDQMQAYLDARALTASLCLREARQYCHVDHNIPEAVKIWLRLGRYAGIFQDDQLTSAIDEASQKCLKFKFFMETDFMMGDGPTDIHGLTAVSEFDFKFTLGGTILAAVGFLNAQGITEPVHDFQAGTISIVDTYLNLETLVCLRTSLIATPGPIRVDNFIADMVAGRKPVLRIDDPNPEVRSQFLCRDPQDADSAFTMDLPPTGSEKYFLGIFHATHGQTGLDEMNKEGYFDLRNAIFANSPKYIEAVYNHIVDGVIHEVTTIVVHHTPED